MSDTIVFVILAIIVITIPCILWFSFRIRLNPDWPAVHVPIAQSLPELATWLSDREHKVSGVIPGAEACIQFADPDSPSRTRLCFVYVHGFSATYRESAPVTERIARAYDANVVQARLKGHGTNPETMVTPAEEWLVSMAETFEIASQLGDKLVIVATSTGAPLSVWLATQPQVAKRVHALLFMSPNFHIRNRFDFLLTAPFARLWIHLVLGERREWEPENDEQARYWTHSYSVLALIEMQKTVDWLKQQPLGEIKIPLSVMYMKNDPTIDPAAAISGFERWGATEKRLIEVAIDGNKPDHVFCGDIVGSHRTDWVVDQFCQFLDSIS